MLSALDLPTDMGCTSPNSLMSHSFTVSTYCSVISLLEGITMRVGIKRELVTTVSSWLQTAFGQVFQQQQEDAGTGASILVYPVSGCVLVGRYYNEGGDTAETGYNSKFMAPDKDGKAQIIVTDKEDHIFFIFNIPR